MAGESSNKETRNIPTDLPTKEEGNVAKIQQKEPDTVTKIKELQEMSAHIPREYCDEDGKPKEVGGWELIFAKLFMLTHPGMKLRAILNGGKPFLNPSNSEQIMYNKHRQVLKLNEYAKKKNEYFPEDVETKANKNMPKQEAVPVAA